MATYKRYIGNKLMVLVLLSLISNVISARLRYSARYEKGVGGKPGTTMLAQHIADEHEQPILEHMSEWSDG